MSAGSSRIDLAQLAQRLEQALSPEPRVAAAIVFGSTVMGRAGAGSDIDLGVLLAPPPRPEERYALVRAILSALVGHVATERVDLILLDDAPPALAFRALAHGRVVFCRDVVALHRFRVRTYRMRADYARVEELFRRATRARALARERHG